MNSTIAKLLVGFVTLIVGALLLGVIATSIVGVTAVDTAVTDNFNIANARLYVYSSNTLIGNETLTTVENVTGESFSVAGLAGVNCTVTTPVFTNATGGEIITSTNYTVTNCLVKSTANSPYINKNWNVTFTYKYGTQWGAINTTYVFSAPTILSHPASTSWKTDESTCAITSINLKNQTGGDQVATTAYTWVTDGNQATGSLTLKNVATLNSTTSNSTTITYQTCPDDYLTQSWSRDTLLLVVGLFAVALLVFSVGMFYSLAKDLGVF